MNSSSRSGGIRTEGTDAKDNYGSRLLKWRASGLPSDGMKMVVDHVTPGGHMREASTLMATHISSAVGVVSVVFMSISIVTATPVAADCATTSGVTICSQGDVRGSDSGSGPSATTASPWYPYPCEYDYYCDDYGMSIIVGGGDGDLGINRPGRPNPPGRPGGGGGRGGGGGGRR